MMKAKFRIQEQLNKSSIRVMWKSFVHINHRSNTWYLIFDVSIPSPQHRRQFHTSSPSHPSKSTTSPHSIRNNSQLYYVTERILAAVLPSKESQVNNPFEYDENGNRSGDKFETDLLHMLEQKHGTKFRLFDLESCIPSISLERLCELCKHIEAWLSSGQNKIVVLQDR